MPQSMGLQTAGHDLVTEQQQHICIHTHVYTHANLEISAVATGLEKVSFHSNPKQRRCQKNVQTTVQLLLFHMLAR